jgi:hypothetical protein
MSGALLFLEAVGISAAAVGVVLAQNPPEDLRAWWDRQDWLHDMIMPMAGRGESPNDLSILPWEDAAVPSALPAADVPADVGDDVGGGRADDVT